MVAVDIDPIKATVGEKLSRVERTEPVDFHVRAGPQSPHDPFIGGVHIALIARNRPAVPAGRELTVEDPGIDEMQFRRAGKS